MARRSVARSEPGSARSSVARPKAASGSAPAPKAGPGGRRAHSTPTEQQILRDGLGLSSEQTAQSQAVFGNSPGRSAGEGWDGLPPQVLEPLTPRDPEELPPDEVRPDVLTPVPQVQGATRAGVSGDASLPLTAQALRSELRAANRLQCSEQRLYSRLPRLDQVPISYHLVDGFLQGLEKEARNAGWADNLLDLAFSQMAVHVQQHYTDLLDKRYPNTEHTYQRLVTVMIGSVAAEQPEQYLAKALKEMKLPDRAAWSIYAEVRRVHRAYESLCKRLDAVPRYAEKDFVLFFLRCLDPVSADSLRRTAPQHCHEDLYAMAKYATEIEGRLAADTALPLPGLGQASATALPSLADLVAAPAGVSAPLQQVGSAPLQQAASATATMTQAPAFGVAPVVSGAQPLTAAPSAVQQPIFQQQPLLQQPYVGQQPNVVQQTKGIQQPMVVQQPLGVQQQMPLPAGGQLVAERQPWGPADVGTFQPQRRWRPQRPPAGPWGQPRGARPLMGRNGGDNGARQWQPRKVMLDRKSVV